MRFTSTLSMDGEKDAIRPDRRDQGLRGVSSILMPGVQTVLYFRLHRESSPESTRDQWDDIFDAAYRKPTNSTDASMFAS